MLWFQTIRVRLNERAVIFDKGLPLRALPPGDHRVWGSRLSEQRWCTDQLLFDALPEVRAMLPAAWYREVTLGPRERGILVRDGRSQVYLRPGTYRYWALDPGVSLRILSLDAPLPPLDEDLQRIMPASEVARRTVEAHERGLLFIQGQLVQELEPGQYAVWSPAEAPARITGVDMRAHQVTLAPQDVMTRDKVTLRLTLTAEYAVVDASRFVMAASDARDAVYLLVQLAARDFVASVSLDELLEGRDAITRHLEAAVAPRAEDCGVRLSRAGVKDIVLPGEMKTLLNRVIEAEKAAAANVITRREEAAATRLLANTAKIMAEQPLLVRLKELETLKEVAAEIDEVRLVVGAGGLDKLLSPDLLGPRN